MILAVDVLHREEVEPLDHPEVVDAADMRMRDLPCDPYLVAEPGEGGLAHVGGREELEGDRLVEDQIVGAVDLAHAALAEPSEDAVAAGEHRAGNELRTVESVR